MSSLHINVRINVVLTAFLQSSSIVTQRKPALVVLVHKQASVIKEHSWKRSSAALVALAVLQFRVQDLLILARGAACSVGFRPFSEGAAFGSDALAAAGPSDEYAVSTPITNLLVMIVLRKCTCDANLLVSVRPLRSAKWGEVVY